MEKKFISAGAGSGKTYRITTEVANMVKDGVNEFYECGTDDTLQKIVKRMTPESLVTSILHTPAYEGKVHDYSLIKE